MFIDGFGFAGYRSFGEPVQRIGPLRKINLFVGQNNSGKSNILSFLTRLYRPLVDQLQNVKNPIPFDAIDRYQGQPGWDFTFDVAVAREGARFITFRATNSKHGEAIDQIMKCQALADDNGLTWFRFRTNRVGNALELDPELLQKVLSEGVLHVNGWHDVQRLFTNGSTGGDLLKHVLPTVLKPLAASAFGIPPIEFIPAIRRIGATGEKATDRSGLDLIDRLAELQNPDVHERDKKKDFENINRFLQEVTGHGSAELEIPHNRTAIMVHMDGRTLPLTSLGTGIHEVIILAAAATVLQDQILCIEEPELHLHPLLQRKLIRYLAEHTSNQYFITTHSAHILDFPDAAVFHVRHQGQGTTVEAVSNSTGRAAICADLGYRASDIVQANSIIWVEGPSDRVYLNHWIAAMAPELVEGIHYSIMFYGGRLLSHLTADDPEVADFISLRRLNRHIAILIDSDRRAPGGKLNDTKLRIREEFDKGPGFAWITKGREIENYIDPDILFEAVKRVHPSALRLEATGQFNHCLFFRNKSGVLKEDVDKVKVAHEVVKYPANLGILDLTARVKDVVEFIWSANDPDVAA